MVSVTPRREETAAIFARVPRAEAEKLERLSYELKVPKQAIIAGLLARHPEPGEEASETGGNVSVGRVGFRPDPAPDVLTLEQLAALLQLDVEMARGLAETGDLPGRKLGDEWRFARDSVLAWLSGERR
jgi:excisionase family DNA binding protein